MTKRRLERIAAAVLSILMLLTSTGIVSTLAIDVSESSAMSTTSVTEAATTVTESGTTTTVTQPSTTVAPQESKGNGTAADPYKISSDADFLAMNSRINSTADGNKYFILTDDIDLSAVTEADFKNGSLVSQNKSLSASTNVYFVLDGNSHTIKNLNVKITASTAAAIFGFIGAKSSVKNISFANCKIESTSTKLTDAAIVALENQGIITDVTVTSPVMTIASSANAGVVAANNSGTISNVEVKSNQSTVNAADASAHTISAVGNVGAVAGVNSGKITAVSAINVGMFFRTDSDKATYYGGIVGANSGFVTSSVATGNALGKRTVDIAGGIVGRAVAANGKSVPSSVLADNYTLVALGTSGFNAIIGADGNNDMMNDCYWSGYVSGKSGFDTGDISAATFKVLTVGQKFKLTTADVAKFAWGGASISLSGGFSLKGDGASAAVSDGAIEVTANKADTASYIKFTVEIKLPATIGAGSSSVTIKQNMRVAVLAVPVGTKGDGSASNPLVVENANELSFINSAPYLSVKLGKDFSFGGKLTTLRGMLDGNGHTLTVRQPIISTFTGVVKNVNIIVAGDITSAVLGNAYGAEVTDVNITARDGVKLNAASSEVGFMLNKLAGGSVVENSHIKGKIELANTKLTAIGGIAGAIDEDNAAIINSSAAVDITLKSTNNEPAKASAVAPFVGRINSENVAIINSAVSGNNYAGNYAFVGDINAENARIEKMYYTKVTASGAAVTLIDLTKCKQFANENDFIEWRFDNNAIGFFTGDGGDFTIELPAMDSFKYSESSDFTVSCDASKLLTSIKVENGKLVLHVSRAPGVITVKAMPVTVTDKITGLSATVTVSNGLEKDAKGNYLVASPYDLAYISENISELHSQSFIVTADIDMSVIKSFAPIGSTAQAFDGKFDGQGHTITNITIDATAKVGLFGVLSNADVHNLIISNANINSVGGYAAVLAGHAVGKTVISNITVNNSTVKSSDINSAILVGSVDSTVNGLTIKNITLNNNSITSTANYVGAVAGNVSGPADISAVKINGFKASGADYIGGVVGCTETASLSDITVSNAELSGVSYVSGIASGKGNAVTLNDVQVIDSSIKSLNTAGVVGGISAVFGSNIKNAAVKNVKLNAGIVGGIVGKTLVDGKLNIEGAQVIGTTIESSGANTIAAGVLAVHNVKGAVEISGISVDSTTAVSGAAVTAGLVGDCTGADSVLKLSDSKLFATVSGSLASDAIASAGALGRIGSSAINNITISSVKIGGEISGNAVLGGIVGIVKRNNAYTSANAMIVDCVAYPLLTTTNTKASVGMIIGAVENDKDVNNTVIASDTVISTYFGEITAYPADSGILAEGYADIDKPNGKPITSSVRVLHSADATEITINNLPTVSGYKFDTATGWISESSDRVEVLKFTENTATLKAHHMADISIIGYYVLVSDADIRIPVHFAIESDIRTPLKGTGTETDPYLVSSAYDMETVAQYADEDAYFVLTTDIVFTPADFEFGGGFYNVGNGIVTIGTAEAGFKGNFSGLYNGKVHSITGLKVAGNTFGGLFGALDGARISDLIINSPDISGLTYAGVIAGSAIDSAISNITINSAKVCTTDIGGYSAAVVAFAENTRFNGITVSGAEVSTSMNSGLVAVEIAGGVAAELDGALSNISLNSINLCSDSIVGGAVGTVKEDKSVVINKLTVDGTFTAPVAGGVFGLLSEPTSTVNDALVMGTVCGTDAAAGVIAAITTENSKFALDSIDCSMLKNVVTTADIDSAEFAGAIIGKVSEQIFTEAENEAVDVFDSVYYSSYNNEHLPFGTQSINAYQGGEYEVTDLNSVQFVSGGTVHPYLPITSKVINLNDSSFRLGDIESFRSFKIGSTEFKLKDITSDIEGLVSYNSGTTAITFASVVPEDADVILVYNNGLTVSIPVASASSEETFEGLGTADAPYLISDTDDFKILMENASGEGVYYKLTADISLAGVEAADCFAGMLDGDGHVLYDFNGASLFATVTGEVRNIGLVGFKVSEKSAVAVGALAGVLDGAKIDNVYVIADVTAGGSVQDAGILAGRAVNAAAINNVLISGKVIGANTLAIGGAVGTAINSTVNGVTSTAYVDGGKSVGGIIGEAEYSTLDRLVFAGMIEADGANILGKDSGSEVGSAYYDSSVTKSIDSSMGTALSTSDMMKLAVDGFKSVGGYLVPETLTLGGTAKFKTGVAFASTVIKYLSGLNAGTASAYTDIKTETMINSNEIKLDMTDGLNLILLPTADYADCSVAVARYANPASDSTVNVNCVIVDSTASLGDSLIGVGLKIAFGDTSSSFNFFTRANAQPKSIDAVSVKDGELYVSALVADGYKYTVTATDNDGKSLSIEDAKNEGYLVTVGSSENVTISINIEADGDKPWGIRSLWTVIG